MDFGARLAELRKERGFPQLELAEQAGLSRRMLAYYEGQSEHPPTTHLPGIARALGVTTDERLGWWRSRQRHGRRTAACSRDGQDAACGWRDPGGNELGRVLDLVVRRVR